MLTDFDFLGHLSERCSITSSVFTNNSYLLCSFGHFVFLCLFCGSRILNISDYM